MSSSSPVAFITGASRGIGKAGALALAEAGYDVVVTARTLHAGEKHDYAASTAEAGKEIALPGSVEETAALVEERGQRALPRRPVLRHMRERQSGTVINTTSNARPFDPPNETNETNEGSWGFVYGASKSAFHLMARFVHVEFKDEGMRADNIDPGYFPTGAGRSRSGETFHAPSFVKKHGLLPGWPPPKSERPR